MKDTIEPIDVLRTAVSFGLPGANPQELPLSAEVISLANTHRVQGLLWSAIEGGAITGEEALIERASEALLAGLRTCLISEETAVLALTALGSAGVDMRVLKGIAIAHLDHCDPAERLFGDADILIRRADYNRALAALAAAGFQRAEPPVRSWWEHRFGKAVVLDAPAGGELDLHLAITGGYFGERIDHQRLWASAPDSFELAGRPVRSLDREGRLLHACCHAALGGQSGLRAKRDIAQLLLHSGADWEKTRACAQHDGVELVLAEAVRATWGDLNLDRDDPRARWATSYIADPVQQRALAGYTAAFAEGWAPEGRSILFALSPFDRVRFLAGLAAPSRASMRYRHRTWPRHLRLGVATIRGGA